MQCLCWTYGQWIIFYSTHSNTNVHHHHHTHTLFPFQVAIYLWGGVGKFLAQPTFWSRRTESIVSLERRACSCAELQVLSYYRSWKEACQATRAISTTSRLELSSRIFFLQGKALKEIYVILIETLGEHAPWYATVKNGWPSLNLVIFPPVLRLVLDDPKQCPLRGLLIKFKN